MPQEASAPPARGDSARQRVVRGARPSRLRHIPAALQEAWARRAPSPRTGLFLLATAFASLSLIAPVNHDESQYVAAAELGWSLQPFQDFLYLQTPLQVHVMAPLAAMSDAWTFIALRLLGGLMGGAVLILVYRSQRLLGVTAQAALIATTLLALTHSFQFGAAVVRNDVLPALLATAGLMLALLGLARQSGRAGHLLWAGAGAGFAAAAAVKLTYALPAAAAGAFLALCLWRSRDAADASRIVAFVLGALPFGLFLIAARMSAPAAFDYGVFGYGAHAPFDWYRLNDLAGTLTPGAKLLDTLVVLLRGPALAALAVVIWARGRQRLRGPATAPAVLLDLLVLAGLIAALLPTPTWKQYAIPLLPPLFIRLGQLIDGPLSARRAGKTLVGALSVTAMIGLAQPIVFAWRALGNGSEALAVTREAHWIGDRLRDARAGGTIATLSPHIVVDSGFAPDPRFAMGPFYYRTAAAVPPALRRLIPAVGQGNVSSAFATRAPAAIVTGYETEHRRFRVDLDRELRDYARWHGYRLLCSPFGRAELWIRPLAGRASGRTTKERCAPRR